MTEYEIEPVPGLPGYLPQGEVMIWQGSPDWRVLAKTAFHTRAIAGYFGLLTAFALGAAVWQGIRSPTDLAGVGITILGGIIGVALLHLLAWFSARTTIYTLTDRRLVMRFGIALPKCINLPLSMIGSVDMRLRTLGTGDLAFKLLGEQRLGYLALWPHARAWYITTPQPMMRAVPQIDSVATMMARACMSIQTNGRVVPIESAVRKSPATDQAAAA